MNIDINKKITKKFIIVLVMLILFSFACPKNTYAALELEDFVAIPAAIFYRLEKAVLIFINDIFCNDENDGLVWQNGVAESVYISFTPENIIKGRFLLFDADIFKEVTTDFLDVEVDSDGNATGALVDGKVKLRETIAGWYYALRNFSIVALLSVLVYVGIRMILSTIAQDKAKYKVMFKDWLVALCLVVLMHYIMIGILEVTSIITEAISPSGSNADRLTTYTKRISGILSESYDNGDTTGLGLYTDYKYMYEEDDIVYGIGDAYAYIIVIAAIIIYTIIFAIKYLKRVFTIMFLILLGPISCITYPIDKISDGKAQAYNKWFSEFLYQVIIQPFHLLLYVVLIGTAAELADVNIIYSLVSFAVMIPAEKFVKEMFGFKDKLGSPLGAFGAGAMASKAMHALMNKGKGSVSKGDGNDGNNGKDGEDGNSLPPQTVDDNNLIEGNDGNNDESQPQNNDNNNEQIDDTEAQRRMLDAYDDNENRIKDPDGYGGYNYNPEERDAMAREAYKGEPGMQYSDDEYRNILKDSGYTDEEIAKEMGTDGGEEPQPVSEGTDGGEEPQPVSEGADGGEEPQPVSEGANGGEEPQPVSEGEQQAEGENDDNNGEQPSSDKSPGKWQRFKASAGSAYKKYSAMHNKRMVKKYGTTSKGKRWARRIGRGLKIGGKAGLKTLKYAAIATAGAAALATALATGNGKEALAVASGLVGYTGKELMSGGKKAIKGATGYVKGAAKDYKAAFRKDDERAGLLKDTKLGRMTALRSKEELAFKAAENDPKKIEEAYASYEQRTGEIPNNEQLKQELKDRFVLSRKGLNGLNESQKANAVGVYQNLREENGGYDKEALDQVAYASGLAADYSNKDYRSEKTMNEARETLKNKFIAKGLDEQSALKTADKYLRMSARIKGTEIALPPIKETIDMKAKDNNVCQALGIQEDITLEPSQIERMNEITVRLHSAGATRREIQQIASTVKGNNVTEILDKYETTVKYLDDEGVREKVGKQIEARNGGTPATKAQVDAHMKENLVLRSTFDVKNERELSRMRASEMELGSKRQVQAAREFAVNNRGQLNNQAHMATAEPELINKLVAGGSTKEKAVKDANNIINQARIYNNEFENI